MANLLSLPIFSLAYIPGGWGGSGHLTWLWPLSCQQESAWGFWGLVGEIDRSGRCCPYSPSPCPKSGLTPNTEGAVLG